MNNEDRAQESTTEDRQHDAHQQSRLNQAKAEGKKIAKERAISGTQAQESTTEDRQYEAHQQSRLNCAEAEVGISGKNAASGESSE